MSIAFDKIMIHLCSGDADENSLVSILLLALHHLPTPQPLQPPSPPLAANSPIVTIPYLAVNFDIHSSVLQSLLRRHLHGKSF